MASAGSSTAATSIASVAPDRWVTWITSAAPDAGRRARHPPCRPRGACRRTPRSRRRASGCLAGWLAARRWPRPPCRSAAAHVPDHHARAVEIANASLLPTTHSAGRSPRARRAPALTRRRPKPASKLGSSRTLRAVPVAASAVRGPPTPLVVVAVWTAGRPPAEREVTGPGSSLTRIATVGMLATPVRSNSTNACLPRPDRAGRDATRGHGRALHQRLSPPS